MIPNPRFRVFDRRDLERGLADMAAQPAQFNEDLRTAIRAELVYRIENPGYEADCRVAKALTGGYG